MRRKLSFIHVPATFNKAISKHCESHLLVFYHHGIPIPPIWLPRPVTKAHMHTRNLLTVFEEPRNDSRNKFCMKKIFESIIWVKPKQQSFWILRKYQYVVSFDANNKRFLTRYVRRRSTLRPSTRCHWP